MLNLQALFAKKNAQLMGVDISSSGVKIVQLSRVGKKMRLDGYACESLPKGAVINGEVANVSDVLAALNKALNKSGCSAKNVALAMPNNEIITRSLSFPLGFSDHLIEQQIEDDLAEHIPFPVDEVRFDFCKTGKLLADDAQEVLLVASKRDLVDGRIEALEALGLNPIVMDVEPFCVQRTVSFMAEQLPGAGNDLILAYVDVGALTLSITVISGADVLFEREQPFGGGQLTQDIARTYNLKIEEAEKKKRSGDLPPDYGTNLLQPFVESAAVAIARNLQFFFTSTPYSRVDQIMLGGGCAALPGMVDAVVAKTQMPTTLSQPIRGMDVGAKVKERQLHLDAPMLTVAFGLALRGFEDEVR